MKYSLVVIFIGLTFSFLIKPERIFNVKHVQPDSLQTVRLTFVGDIMCHGPEFESAKVAADSFDFRPMFGAVKNFLSSSDLTFGNLETTIAGKNFKYSGYPLFNSPSALLYALKDAGFDILFTSNNHCMDRGEKGILNTIKKIRDNSLSYAGTNESQHDRDSIRTFDVHGIKIAVLAYTYGVNGNYIPKNAGYLVNLIDTLRIKNDIRSARAKSIDVILVYFHFGMEYQRQPNSYQQEIVKHAIAYGANIIIGSHPHVIEPVQYFQSKDRNFPEGIVAYSLGNFISNQRWRYSDCGVILNLTLTKNIISKRVSISKTDFIPTWVFKGKAVKENEFIILPSDTSEYPPPAYLSKADKRKLTESFADTENLLRPSNDEKIFAK